MLDSNIGALPLSVQLHIIDYDDIVTVKLVLHDMFPGGDGYELFLFSIRSANSVIWSGS